MEVSRVVCGGVAIRIQEVACRRRIVGRGTILKVKHRWQYIEGHAQKRKRWRKLERFSLEGI